MLLDSTARDAMHHFTKDCGKANTHNRNMADVALHIDCYLVLSINVVLLTPLAHRMLTRERNCTTNKTWQFSEKKLCFV